MLNWPVYAVALLGAMFGCAALCTFGRVAGLMP